jgi:hypothetical protein
MDMALLSIIVMLQCLKGSERILCYRAGRIDKIFVPATVLENFVGCKLYE